MPPVATESPHIVHKPLLFVDIVGVISLFGFPPDRRPPGAWANVDGVVHLLSATARGHLLELSEHFELVWASGWEEKANEHLPVALELPGPLPYLTFAPADTHGHWKLAALRPGVTGLVVGVVDPRQRPIGGMGLDRCDLPVFGSCSGWE